LRLGGRLSLGDQVGLEVHLRVELRLLQLLQLCRLRLYEGLLLVLVLQLHEMCLRGGLLLEQLLLEHDDLLLLLQLLLLLLLPRPMDRLCFARCHLALVHSKKIVQRFSHTSLEFLCSLFKCKFLMTVASHR